MGLYDDPEDALGLFGPRSAAQTPSAGFLGLSGADWAQLAGMALGNLTVYPQGYYGSGGLGVNVGRPLAALGALLGYKQDQAQKQQQQQAFSSALGKLFPDLDTTALQGMDAKDMRALLPDLLKQSKEKRSERAASALPDILKDVEQPPQQTFTGFTPIPSPSLPTPPDTENPLGAGLFGQVGALLRPPTDTTPAEDYRPTYRAPKVSEQLQRIQDLPAAIRGEVSTAMAPQILKAREAEAQQVQQRQEQAAAARAFLQEVQASAPDQMTWAKRQVSAYLGSNGKTPLPKLDEIVPGAPGTQFFKKRPWGELEETGMGVPTKEDKPPAPNVDYLNAVANGLIKDPRFTAEQARQALESRPVKPTQTQQSIQDWLESKGLANTAENRDKARQALKAEGEASAIRVATAATKAQFGLVGQMGQQTAKEIGVAQHQAGLIDQAEGLANRMEAALKTLSPYLSGSQTWNQARQFIQRRATVGPGAKGLQDALAEMEAVNSQYASIAQGLEGITGNRVTDTLAKRMRAMHVNESEPASMGMKRLETLRKVINQTRGDLNRHIQGVVSRQQSAAESVGKPGSPLSGYGNVAGGTKGWTAEPEEE